jgi:hypothetical protein
MRKLLLLGCLIGWLCLTAEQCPTYGAGGDSWDGIYIPIPCEGDVISNCPAPTPTQAPIISPSM